MRKEARKRRHRLVLMALLCASVVTAAPFLGAAEAKKKAKKKSIAGKYVGTTEEKGTVSFKLTRAGKILNFTLTNATMYCHTDVPNENPTYFPEYTRVITIRHGPMQMEKISKKNPQGKRFNVDDPLPEGVPRASGLFTGHIENLRLSPNGSAVSDTLFAFAGEVTYDTTNGPFGVPGTEWCVSKYIDWQAKRPGDKGYY